MMDSLQRFFIAFLVVAGVFFLYNRKWAKHQAVDEIEHTRGGSQEEVFLEERPVSEAAAAPMAVMSQTAKPIVAEKTVKPVPKGSAPPKDALPFRMDDGVAVVQGDLVVGELVEDDGTVESGYVKMPTLNLWTSHVIPYFVDPGMREPDRVLKAFDLFSGTVIQFVPFDGTQEDVMVFQEGTGICKSYVGRVGGKQPLWIAPGCRPDDIAHEIMHALGFVHEQNRSDRDQFITMNPENIEEQYQDNFFRLPPALMTVSGLAPFDFESLMIYPTDMFSKNRQPTMQSKVKEQEIHPGATLSPRDIERVNKAYGGRM